MLYRYNFFILALDELSDFMSENIKLTSLAHRLSKLNQEDYDKMMKRDGDNKIIVDHEENLKQFQKGL